jgi:ABC-type transport system involved in multi-copper enzyme maturation permease subunit
MRSGLAAGLMGIGWIFISFGAVIAILYVLARQAGDALHELPAMATMTVGSLVVGGVMFAAGFLLSRVGRNSDRASGSDRSIA